MTMASRWPQQPQPTTNHETDDADRCNGVIFISLASFTSFNCCLMFRFLQFDRNVPTIMAMVTMVMAILSQISNGFGSSLTNSQEAGYISWNLLTVSQVKCIQNGRYFKSLKKNKITNTTWYSTQHAYQPHVHRLIQITTNFYRSFSK